MNCALLIFPFLECFEMVIYESPPYLRVMGSLIAMSSAVITITVKGQTNDNHADFCQCTISQCDSKNVLGQIPYSQTCPQHYIATLKNRTIKQFDEKGLLLHWESFASMHKLQRTDLIIVDWNG